MRYLVGFMSVLMLLPWGAAQAAPALHLAGPFTVQAPVAAWRADSHASGSLSGFDLRLDAAQVREVVNERSASTTVLGFETPYRNATLPERDFTAATLSTNAVRGDFSVTLVAAPGDATGSVSGTDGVVTVASGQVESRTDVAAGQPPLGADLSRELAAASPGALHLAVHGTFALSLWDWDLHVHSPSGDTDAASGTRSTGTGPAGASTSDQVFLFVSNGTLQVTLPAAPGSRFYGAPMEVQASTLYREGSPAPLQGDRAHVTREGEALALGPLSASAALPATALGGPTVTAWMGVGAGAALFLGLAWRWRQARAYRGASLAMQQGEYGRVLRRTGLLLWSRRHRPAAAVLRTVSLLRLERYGDAEALLARPALWPASSAATRDYLGAYVQAARGERRGAVALLAACLRRAPEMVLEVQANALLGPLLGDPALRMWARKVSP
ncbi:MAG: hypothetical protein ACYDBQ_02590 [Thermoplasmatota archaeon]